MIKFNNVDFSYGENKVLNNFSLNINKGDRICFFGESGCGKTTVLRLILGLEKPDNGEIVKIPNLKPAVVFQEDRLLPFKTVLENITFLNSDKEKALYNLNALSLGDYADKYPSELSGGMSRRVSIARALSLDFDYLVLDEPFTGQDNENILKTVALINENLGCKPLILVTHSKEEAELLNCKIKEMI